MKRIKALFLCVFFLFACTFCAGCGGATSGEELAYMRGKLSENKYIIHACGEIADEEGEVFTYTNSRDALEKSYDAGCRVIEIDFRFTSDGHLVCNHAWGELTLDGENLVAGEAPDYETYLKCRFQDRFELLSVEDVVSFMREHEDLIVVTDIKDDNVGNCEMIAREYPDLMDNFVIQIYHADEFAPVSKLGFKYIIYTLYETEEDERTQSAIEKIAKMGLVGFTIYSEWADDPDFYEMMNATGLPLYVHTVNEDAQLEHYFSMGADAIYTDRTDLQ